MVSHELANRQQNTVSSNLSLDSEIDKRIAKTAAVLSKLSKRVWENSQLTFNTKLKVYQACVLSTLLYGSESWKTYARQENHLESFHLRCLRRIMGITWQNKVTNVVVLEKAGSLSFSVGSVMYVAWRAAVYQRTFCMVSWLQDAAQ